MEVVAELARGDQVVDAALKWNPDVALLDIEIPGTDGYRRCAAQGTGAQLPQHDLTTFGRPGFLTPGHGERRGGILATGRAT